MFFRKEKKIKELQTELRIVKDKNEDLNSEKFILYKTIENQQKQNQDLADIISGKTKDCQIGPWCKTCQYYYEGIVDKCSAIYSNYCYYPTATSVAYCTKHILSICPEFENKQEPTQ